MRILYFHQHFVTPRGAGGVRSYAMACKLVERGHQVTMVCGSFLGGASGLSGPFRAGLRRGFVDGIDLIELDLAYSNEDGYVRRTITFLQFAIRSIVLGFTEKYDIVFATTTPLTAGIPGIFARWVRGKPFVFEVRDLWPELPRAMGVIKNPFLLWSMSCLEWVTYKSASKLIGLSPGIIDGISKKGVPRESIALIPNGCDINIFSEYQHSWRPKGIKANDFMAVYAGTHGVANGLDACLDAAAELKKRGRNDIKLLLIGQGKLKADLQRRALFQGLNNVVFHDPVNKRSLAGLMKSADLGIQCLENIPAFYYGTSPNKFFDYLAAGLPVLCNYPGWISELIADHKCGLTVAPNNPVFFADALEWAADNRSYLKTLGENSIKLAVTMFDRQTLSDQFVDWIEGAKFS